MFTGSNHTRLVKRKVQYLPTWSREQCSTLLLGQEKKAALTCMINKSAVFKAGVQHLAACFREERSIYLLDQGKSAAGLTRQQQDAAELLTHLYMMESRLLLTPSHARWCKASPACPICNNLSIATEGNDDRRLAPAWEHHVQTTQGLSNSAHTQQ